MIGEPVPASDEPFLLMVQETFRISGRGTVVTGRIERGTLRIGDELEIVGPGRSRTTACAGIDRLRRVPAMAEATVGVLLRGVTPDEVRPGDVLRRPAPPCTTP